MGALIAVDWGSTNFRAFLLDANGCLLDKVEAPAGFLTVKNQAFAEHLHTLVGHWPAHLPVLMAGMVGSKQGWCDAGYISCPASLASIASGLCKIDTASRPVYLVPGLSVQAPVAPADVMRGEEVQVLGALQLQADTVGSTNSLRVCLPGTHSKWVRLERIQQAQQPDWQVSAFATYMTGELFQVLSEHSLLGRGFDGGSAINMAAFDEGLAQAAQASDLTHQLFGVRSRWLLGELAQADMRSYLSGLLIGHEISSAGVGEQEPVLVVGNDKLAGLYLHALQNAAAQVQTVDGDGAVCAGLCAIARQTGLL